MPAHKKSTVFQARFSCWQTRSQTERHCLHKRWFFLLRKEGALLTACSTVLLEKLTGSHLVKKFPAFYGTRRFIVAFKQSDICPCPESDQSSPCSHPASWISILILSFHLSLELSSGLFRSDFPTKTLYAPLFYPVRATWRCTNTKIKRTINTSAVLYGCETWSLTLRGEQKLRLWEWGVEEGIRI